MAVVAILLISCGQGKKPDEQAFLNSLDSAQNGKSSIDAEVIGKVRRGIGEKVQVKSEFGTFDFE